MAKRHKTELDVDPTSQPVIEEEKVEETSPAPSIDQTADIEEEEEEGKPKKKLTKKAIIILAVGISGFISLVITIVAGYFYFSKEEEPVAPIVAVEPEKKEPVQKAPVTFEKAINLGLEPFTIPFEKDGEKHFWRVAFSIQLSNAETVDEIEENISIIREAIFIFLQTHKVGDFLDLKKRRKTLYDMEILLDRSLQTGRVREITIIESTIM